MKERDCMGFWFVVGAIVLFVLISLLSDPSRRLYHCQRCGFETYSEAEALGHERLENGHKAI